VADLLSMGKLEAAFLQVLLLHYLRMILPWQHTGVAADRIATLKSARMFPRARFDIAGKHRGAQRLVIALGQMHPVLTGRFRRLEARSIGKIQAWIAAACERLLQKEGVGTFGQEGFSGDGYARLSDVLLMEYRSNLSTQGAEHFLLSTAQRWRRALKRRDGEEAERAATALNALAVLQALHPQVTIFPIEQMQAHAAVGEGIAILQAGIRDCEAKNTYRSARAKGGKRLTQEEFEAMQERNALVKRFNALLASPQRDRAILREVLEHAQSPLTVFVLGQAHKKNMLRLARKHLPEDTLLLWVTPPQFWWAAAWSRRARWVIAAACAGVLWYAFTSVS